MKQHCCFIFSFLKFFLVAVLALNTGRAQEQIGTITDNYLPASSSLFNPAADCTSPYEVDINALGAGFSVYNNLVYLDKFSFLSLSGKNLNGKEVVYNTPNTIRAFTRVGVQGPSVMIRQGDFTLGIITQVRSAASVTTSEVPVNLDFNHIIEDSLYQFPAGKTTGLNWMSIGLHLGETFGGGDVRFSVAGNLNYLIGWDGISAVTDQTLDFVKNSQDATMSFNNVKMNYGYTSGFGGDVQQNLSSMQFKGSGVSADFGFLVMNGKRPLQYTWKLGVSLMDLGIISFSKNVQRYNIITDTAVTVTQSEFNNLNSADAFTEMAAEAIAGKGTMNFVDGPLVINLPAAISIQGEVRVAHHCFINAMYVQSLVLSDQQVLRPNSIAITPRYETVKVAAGVPFSLNDNQRVQVGGFVRLGPLMVGTDNLGAVFIPSKFEGADLYVALHLSSTLGS